MKRSLTTGKPSTPRKKKPKVETGQQSSLDSFFSSPGQKCMTGAGSGKGKAKLSSSITPAVSDLTALERDEAFARSLAEQDGLTPDILLKLEQKASHQAAVPTNNRQPEVIDVDLLDDDNQAPVAGPSKPYTVDPSLSKRASNSASSQPSRKLTKAAFSSKIATNSTPTFEPLAIDPTAYDLDGLDWSHNAPIPYSFLAHTLSTLSETRSRIVILNTLTNCLRSISKYHPPSLLPSLYLLSNSLSPPYSPLELGLGHSIISKAIQQVSGLTPAALKRLYTTTGDPGAFEGSIKRSIQ